MFASPPRQGQSNQSVPFPLFPFFILHSSFCISFACLSLLLVTVSSATASDNGRPSLTLAPVFTAGTDGYHTYRIPVMVVTTNGTVLAFCEGRKNGAGDAGHIDLLLKRSTNSGVSWSAQQIVWADGDNCCDNAAPVVDHTTGVMWLLMNWADGADKEFQIVHRQSRNTRRVFVTHSSDDGVTWAKPVEITASVKKSNWDWYAMGPATGIQIVHGPHAGRLVVPCNSTELDEQGRPVSFSLVIFSDDHGATWHIGGTEDRDTNESTITELSDGTLMQNIRITGRQHRRAVATSKDGGITWSAVRFDEALIEPVCEGNILRYNWPAPGARPSSGAATSKESSDKVTAITDKGRILFSNPASLKRENLTVRVSYDDGTTWAVSKTIYPGPAAYSCEAVLPDGTIGCLFECGTNNAYEKIMLARFPLAWLERGSVSVQTNNIIPAR